MDQAEAGRRVRGAQTWAQARAAYLGGLSAAAVCARHGLGLSALRARARREGWRRGDQPDPTPLDALDPDLAEDLDEELAADGPPDPEAMADRAARLAARALALGRLAEAEGWTRLWRRLRTLDLDAAVAERRAAESQRRAATSVLDALKVVNPLVQAAVARAEAARAEVHSVHSVHPEKHVHPAPDDAPSPPVNRAERRRLESLTRARERDRPRPSTGSG